LKGISEIVSIAFPRKTLQEETAMGNLKELVPLQPIGASPHELLLLKWLTQMAVLRGARAEEAELNIYWDKARLMLSEPSINPALGPYRYALSDFQNAFREIEDKRREEGELALPAWADLRDVIDKHRRMRQSKSA
jgi:hypothetical protein